MRHRFGRCPGEEGGEHKHYNDGPAAVKQAREAEANKQVERMTSMMVWMTYGWIIAAGVFLRAAGWM